MKDIIKQLDQIIAKAQNISGEEYLALLKEVKEKEQSGCFFGQIEEEIAKTEKENSFSIQGLIAPSKFLVEKLDLTIYSRNIDQKFPQSNSHFFPNENLPKAA